VQVSAVILFIIGGRKAEKERLRKGEGKEEKTEPVNIHIHTMWLWFARTLELSVVRHYEAERLGCVKS
jgi:hypothetical protein